MIACLLCFCFVFVLFDISCYCCWFCRVVYVVGEGAGFVKRGVVVGGGFRAPRVPHVARRLGLVAQCTLRLARRMATVGGSSGVWRLRTGMPLGL